MSVVRFNPTEIGRLGTQLGTETRSLDVPALNTCDAKTMLGSLANGAAMLTEPASGIYANQLLDALERTGATLGRDIVASARDYAAGEQRAARQAASIQAATEAHR